MERVSRRLTSVEEIELDELLIAGLERLPIQKQNQERFIVLALHMLLEAIRMGEALPKDLSFDDFCAQMGVVYGEQLCLLFGWEWTYLTLENSYEGAAVMNPEGTCALFPIPALYRWTKIPNPNRCLILFEELEEPKEFHGFTILQ